MSAKKTIMINTSGKRKTAIARATLKSGKGGIKINNRALDTFENVIFTEKIREVFSIAGEEFTSKYDVAVSVNGGGVMSQADAIKLAIGKAFVEVEPKMRESLLAYNRAFLVADTRRKETTKPNSQGSARSKRQKSYR